MAITSTKILNAVKARITIPASQVLLDNEDMLVMADHVIKTYIIPGLESTNQNYFVTTVEVDLVASVSEYDIPYRAIGRALRDIKIKDSNNDNYIRNLALISIEDCHLYQYGGSILSGFYFKGDRLVLVPNVPSNLTNETVLQIWYRLPPSALVESSAVSTVISTTATSVTVDAVPSTIVANTLIDFVRGKAGCRIYEIDQTVSSVTPTTIDFATGVIPSALEAGDYICLAGQSPVVNGVPEEAEPYIVSLTSKRVLAAIGDYEGASALKEDIVEEKKNFLQICEPRITGEPTIIINRSGLVRGNKSSQRRWLYGQ